MALPIETPSRIWRRIRDAEAHEVDMPSLPSLPALDDSGISDLDPPSFSLEKDQPVAEPAISVIQRNETRPSVALPPVNRNRTLGTDPTALSIVPSLPGDPHEEEYDTINEDISSSNRHSLTGKSDNGRDSSEPNQQPVDNGTLHAAYIGSETGQSSKPASLARVSVNGKSSTTAVDPPKHVVELYGNPAPIDKSQGLHISGGGGFPSNAMNMPDFKDVVMHRPYGSTQQVISIPSLPPSSPPLSSPQYTSDSHSPVWTSEVRENVSDHGLDAVTVRPAATREHDQTRKITTGERVEDETGEITEKALRSREPTLLSEEVESTRETGVRFSQATIYPAGWSTPAQSDQPSILEKWTKGIGHGVEDDLATPLPRKKSFLLSVVNSTTRPRISVPTPHPQAKQKMIGISVGTTPHPSHVSHARVRNARLSHPLSQFSVFAPSTPLNAIPRGAEPDDTPDGVTSSSFVSTASSHDLTVHHRANASFDPLTGPQGVGRFNASKLNTYLHGLNRRLQKENELLVDKIKSLQTECEVLYDQGRHRELSGVMEDEAAEQWVLERESLEQKIVELEKQLEARHKELSEEQLLRMQDKERWKNRMSEVEDGVGQIVSDLEKRVEEAETRASSLKDVEQQMQVVQSELDTAKADCRLFKQRAEQAEQLLANADKREINQLRLAGGESSNVGFDMRNSMRQLEERDQHIATLQSSLADKEKETSSLQGIIRDLESSLRITRETIETAQQDAKELRTEQKEAKEELRAAQATIDKLKRESRLASDAAGDLEQQLGATKQRLSEKEEALDVANGRITVTSDELERARSAIQQLEIALEESDRKILSDNNELLNLRSKISVMKREQGNLKEFERSQAVSPQNAAEIEALEVELAEARKEIGRLNTLLEQSPARKALNKAKESRIDLLEKENQELLEQLRTARDPSYYMTPRRSATMSGLSPMHRRLINLTLRTPKTPGEPLRNASWLNATGEITTAHLFDEIGRLQRELDLANESIDDKLDKLEEAGLGVVGLTKALEDARQRIVNLENQLEERGLNLCPQCVERGIGRSTTRDPNATLQLRLTMVAAELEALRKQRDDELASSSGEKAVLRDATKRLNIEIKHAKEELKAAQERGYKAEKSRKELQQELARARKTIDDLEYYLQSERSRLRTMSVENSNAVKEKERILERLYETEQKMEQTKDRLFQLKETNIKLEAKLRIERETANIEEALIGNREIIERLRQERSQLFDKYYVLQQKLAGASKNASDLATKHAKLQLSYDGRRRQLDRQAEEIESLRAALSSQVQAIDAPWLNKKAEMDDDRLKNLACRLQSELQRIQQEANRFGHDLVHLKSEKDELIVRHREELEQHDHETKQIRAQMRNLKQQLVSREESRDFATEIQLATESLRLRHNRECKGLFVQIRYLKAKFTREAALRDDLGYQKGYLLVLLSRYEKSEKKILASIAQIGPISAPAKTTRSKSVRTVALAAIFISRARRVSEAWREQRSACSAVAAALDNVRKNRPLKA